MPCSLMGQRAPSTTFMKMQEDRASLKGTDMLDPRTHSAGTACVEEESRHESTHPSGLSPQTNLVGEHVKMRFF